MPHMGVSADSGSASWSSVQGGSGVPVCRRSPWLSSADNTIELRRPPSVRIGGLPSAANIQDPLNDSQHHIPRDLQSADLDQTNGSFARALFIELDPNCPPPAELRPSRVTALSDFRPFSICRNNHVEAGAKSRRRSTIVTADSANIWCYDSALTVAVGLGIDLGANPRITRQGACSSTYRVLDANAVVSPRR
jgi:hypothetical protein